MSADAKCKTSANIGSRIRAQPYPRIIQIIWHIYASPDRHESIGHESIHGNCILASKWISDKAINNAQSILGYILYTCSTILLDFYLFTTNWRTHATYKAYSRGLFWYHTISRLVSLKWCWKINIMYALIKPHQNSREWGLYSALKLLSRPQSLVLITILGSTAMHDFRDVLHTHRHPYECLNIASDKLSDLIWFTGVIIPVKRCLCYIFNQLASLSLKHSTQWCPSL